MWRNSTWKSACENKPSEREQRNTEERQGEISGEMSKKPDTLVGVSSLSREQSFHLLKWKEAKVSGHKYRWVGRSNGEKLWGKSSDCFYFLNEVGFKVII